MISIRESAFETNSSSTHAIIINQKHIIDEFISGKHFINIATSEIVLEDDIEIEKQKLLENVEKFIDSGFRMRGDDLLGDRCNYRYGFSHVHDRVIDVLYEIMIAETDFTDRNFSSEIRSNPKLKQKYIDLYLDFAFMRFDDMNKDCEMCMNRHSFFTDSNNNVFDAINVYGSDSYDFGEWPTR